MNNILFVDNFKIFEKWASKTYELKLNCLKKHNNFKVIDIDDIQKIKLEDYSKIIFGWNMCIYSKYYTIKNKFYSNKIGDLENFDLIKQKTERILNHKNKYLVVQDLINQDDYENGIISLKNYLKDYNFKGIITPYYKTQSIYTLQNEMINLKIIHMPHHIDETKFKNWNLNKVNDIFIFGNCSKKSYPFRHRIVKLLEDNKDKFKILFWNDLMSRNYFRFKPNISNENLSKQINKSWLTLCTTSHAKVLLGKYIETSMSSSCILGNLPEDYKEIWENNIVEINDDMSDNEIITIIEKSLNNKKELQNKISLMNSRIEIFYLSKYGDKLYKKLS